MKNLYLTDRFFQVFGLVIVLFFMAFPIPFLFGIAQLALLLAVIMVLVDLLILFSKEKMISGRRILPKMLSLGDENKVKLELKNLSGQKLFVNAIDELPVQFQKRDFGVSTNLAVGEMQEIPYSLKPLERGAFKFGNINLYIESILRMVKRRVSVEASVEAPVYPSVIQMKKYELMAFSRITTNEGLKKIRRIGQSYEFEQIKNYVPGDDYRSVNWKASSRRAQLMVNQYEDEKSQQIYSVIDKSRNMRMPFSGLSLMDYAINTALVISNVVLQKDDKAGLLTFSNTLGATIKAERRPGQLNKIITALYKEKSRDLEANYELLYQAARKLIKGRSLVMLYTNFESTQAAMRVLPILRRINNLHLLVVVFFINTEVEDYAQKNVTTTEEIYHQTIARKFLNEKEKISQSFNQFGIQTILTRPEDLSINTINKYLELKARGLI